MNVVSQSLRGMTQGPRRSGDDRVTFTLWAPLVESLTLCLDEGKARQSLPMQPVGDGYFQREVTGVAVGTRYAYRVDDDAHEYPDPASRWQPEGVHEPSAVYLPEDFVWHDQSWRGLDPRQLSIYELHVGAFTPEGTFAAVMPRLSELADLGITAIEIMPVAQFPGARNWGYDGADLYAVQNSYGGPQGLQELVDAAHAVGLGVILDVVYNHFGPEGNYLGKYGRYFRDCHMTPWGPALNYDGPDSDPVRRFVIDNAVMWVRDYHLDGLRLDAVQTIVDLSAYHLLAELQSEVQRAAAQVGRRALVIAETNQNDARIVRTAEDHGFGLDGAWSDDLHHSIHAFFTGERDGYYADFGAPADIAKALTDGFVFDGVYSHYRRRRHGNRADGIPRERFVVCIQNHDQVGNRPLGNRLSTVLSPEALRLAAGLMLLSPGTPLLFMGEEYGETNPFQFFCSYEDPALIEAVRAGRRHEFNELAFDWVDAIPDAQDEKTFISARLSWRWHDDDARAGMRRLYRTLLHARRLCPVLHPHAGITAKLLSTSGEGPLLRIERGTGPKLVGLANLSKDCAKIPDADCREQTWLCSTAECRFGGPGADGAASDRLGAFELALWGDPAWTIFKS